VRVFTTRPSSINFGWAPDWNFSTYVTMMDGTPNFMLEAIAAGALPILSPIDSVQEWITDGENGLLAHALYPDQVAAALQRALMDDALFERAQRLNWEIICQRADRREVRQEVLEYYQNLNQPRKKMIVTI
jgi:glycosyltransferase involved in cell wall biosynthesis